MIGNDEFEAEVYDRIADVLMLLSEVTAGDLSGRLSEGSLPESHPFSPLYRGINETVESLRTAEKQQRLYRQELEEKLSTIERQKAAIRELSTPVIEVWPGVLCVPIVGVMDTARSSDMTEAVLTAVTSRGAECVILDITGIEVMDTGTVDHFLRMARATRLLGTICILTGISPAIAQTVVHMGVDLTGILTKRNLSDALTEYVRGTLDGRPPKEFRQTWTSSTNGPSGKAPRTG